MNKFILVFILSLLIGSDAFSQRGGNRDRNDNYRQNDRLDNPYRNPNYHPRNYRHRAPMRYHRVPRPMSYCAPVYIAPRPRHLCYNDRRCFRAHREYSKYRRRGNIRGGCSRW